MIPSQSPWIPTFLLLSLSLPILFFLSSPPPPPPPISFSDELDDLTLFRRATHPTHQPKPIKLGSTNPKPKIAFLFLTNTNLHFSPLWDKFFSGNQSSFNLFNLYNIYIHADPSVHPKINPPNGDTVFKQERFIPAKKTNRGTATLISAARRLIATAILDDPSNEFFTLISQHCIPLHSFEYFYNTLFEISTHQVAELKNVKFRSFIEIIDQSNNLWDRYNARGRNMMIPEVKYDEFRVGSQFFTITRRHALMIVNERRLWKKFRLSCLKAQPCYPEEHYFSTFLSMEDRKGCTGYTLTRVNWTGTVNGHPHTYYPDELSSELIYDLRKSDFGKDYMFARKFSLDCLSPLMDMADEVIFRD